MENFDIFAVLREEMEHSHYSKMIASQMKCVRLTGYEMTSKTKPLIELFVKSSSADKREKGPCLIGQQWFMTLYCLVEQGLIDLRFTPMSLETPTPNYTNLSVSRHLPVAWIVSGQMNGTDMTGKTIASSGELEKLMWNLNCPYLDKSLDKGSVLRVEELFEDLYINFINFMSNDQDKPLLRTLTNLDNFFAQNAHRYLMSDQVTYVDCQLMPKLQHLRVTCREHKKFDIPLHLTYLWNYVKLMYETKAFTCSCPSNRDILLHYQEKYPIPKIPRLSLCASEYLCDTPSSNYRKSSARHSTDDGSSQNEN